MGTSRFAAPLALVALAACGGSETTERGGRPVDGGAACGPGASMLDGTCLPAGIPPEACGEGFRATGDGGCDAILPDVACSKGQMAVPGETTCRAVAACGSAPWGAIPVDATTEHVDASYTGGSSDGSAARPWTTIGEAIAAAAPGAVVAVAAGTYTEDLTIGGKPVRLWGRCPGMVELVSPGGAVAALLIAQGAAQAEVHTLAIGGAAAGIDVSGAEGIVLDRLWIHDTALRGIDVEDAFGPVSVSIQASLVEASGEFGLYVGGATVTVEKSVVRGAHAAGQQDGWGVLVQYDPNTARRADLTLTSSLVENNAGEGVVAQGATATIARSVIRDTLPTASDQSHGRGIEITSDHASHERGKLALATSVVANNRESGIIVLGADASIETTVVQDTLAQASNDAAGVGLVFQIDLVSLDETAATVTSSVIERNHALGIFVGASDVTIERSLVRDTLPAADLDFGRGIDIESDTSGAHRSTAKIRGSVIENNFEGGVVTMSSDTTLDATMIRTTKPKMHDGTLGDGFAVFATYAAASASVTASHIEASARAGISSFGATMAIGSTVLECNPIDLDGEKSAIASFAFKDLGGNACGCGAMEETCGVVSANLAPPAPLGSAAP